MDDLADRLKTSRRFYREHDLLMGRVDFGGAIKRACLECVREVQPGDYVLVHVGFALTRMDEAEAQRVWQLLEELGEVEGETDGMTNIEARMSKE